MRRSVPALLGVLVCLHASATSLWAQTTLAPPAAGAELVPFWLVIPTYPPIAQAARVHGVVIVALTVGADGRVESTTIERDIPLLSNAVLKIARDSGFICRGCTGSMPYRLEYRFQFADSPEQREAARAVITSTSATLYVLAETPVINVQTARRPRPRSDRPLDHAAQPSEAVITPVEWPRPVYPQIAQSARVSGDVEVAIDVRPDGAVAAARAVSGSPLLDQAALDAARGTRFECRGCREAITPYSLYVTFRLQDEEHSFQVTPLVVSPTQGWVTVVATPQVIDHDGPRPVDGPTRGIKCLFAWRCDPPRGADAVD
jgi:TonB family protein